ncbi:MAG TPA: hypothetical protein VFY40_03325 [Blastocatellia bacterium]|nr:hypothetical protein [Blastocatellia bacterium]
MKRILITIIMVLPLSSFFSSFKVAAQDPTGALPGTKPATNPSSAPATKPTPTAANRSKPAPTTKVVLTLSVDEESKGNLDPRSSDKNEDGSFYEEMILTVKSEDSLSFHVEGDNPLLGLQLLDKSKAEVPLAKDASGDFKLATATGGAPADGEYFVRVTGILIGKSPVPFKIKVTRLGLTAIAYVERFNEINKNYREDDPASVQTSVEQLEALAKADPSRSPAFERLGIIYLDPLKDFAKAEVALDQAIKNKGVAVIRIAFDSQWRRLEKAKSGDYIFEDARWGWLKIRHGQVTLADPANKPLATVTGTQIKEFSKNLVSAYNTITINAEGARKPYVFMPKSTAPAETDLILKLIQDHVAGKDN